MADAEAVSLGDAVFRFQTVAPQKDAVAAQQMLQKFVRWFGPERSVSSLKAWEIEAFGQGSGVDSLVKLQPVKAFLKYLYDEGMTHEIAAGQRQPANLATHLKVKRSPVRTRQAASRRAAAPASQISVEGHKQALEELEELRAERLLIAEDIKKAMADKDFRENAPLDAARDKQAHNEARIRELEEIIRSAEIIKEDSNGSYADAGRCRVGSRVELFDLQDQERITYTLVHPKEVNAVLGKISVESPVGKALLNKRQGETVEVKAPQGSRRYRIEGVDA